MAPTMARPLNPSRQTTAADRRVATYDVRKVKAGSAAADSTLEVAEEVARNSYEC